MINLPFVEKLTHLRRVAAREVAFDSATAALLEVPVLERYFLNQLNDYVWLLVLMNSSYFGHLSKDEAYRVPLYEYMERIAATAPQAVVNIMRAFPPRSLGEDMQASIVAAALPARDAVQLLPLLLTRLDEIIGDDKLVLPQHLAELVEHFAQTDETEGAFQLADALLQVKYSPSGSRFSIGQLVARLEGWQYQRTLATTVSALFLRDPRRTFDFVCRLLEAPYRAAYKLHSSDSTGLNIRRPAIEPSGQNLGIGLEDALIDGVRDCAERLIKEQHLEVREVVRLLEAKQLALFERIALHLLRIFPDTRLATDHLTTYGLFDGLAYHHEYVLLLQAQFSTLPAPARSLILLWIEQGPREMLRWQDDEPDDLIRKRTEHWQLTRLEPIATDLPEEWGTRYMHLKAKYGQPEHPEFTSYITSHVGPTSAKTPLELSSMAIPELLTYLQTWRPTDDVFGDSLGGLARALTTAVATSPQRYAEAAIEFRNVPTVYASAMLRGLQEASNQDEMVAFDWSPVLILCEWLVVSPEAPASSGFHPHIDQGSARRAIAGLLEQKAFKTKIGSLDFRFRNQAWRILERLTQDAEPDPAYEEKYGQPNMDYATLAINTVRGEGMHAVVSYGLWVFNHSSPGDEGGTSTFDLMPEVRNVLAHHLDRRAEPSLAIRTVYGQYLPWLHLLDEAWLTRHLETIFPEEAPEHRDAAWRTYLRFCAPYNDVLSVLRPYYARAVARLSYTESIGERESSRLGQHLLLYYARGRLEIGAEDQLLEQFFARADNEVRAAAIAFVGRSLRQETDLLPEVIERFQALWNWRITSLPADWAFYSSELAEFVWWAISNVFPVDWTLEQLLQLARKEVKFDSISLLQDYLNDTFGQHQLATIQVLRALVTQSLMAPEWVVGTDGLVALALKSEVSEVREEAAVTLDLLLTAGHLQYMKLIPLLNESQDHA